jgi:hypothetical protein
MYQYKIINIATYTKKQIPQAEDSLNDLAAEGWEPFMVSSSIDLSQTVFLRRTSPNA